MGYDFNRGRQDLSPHPFTISFNPYDVRVTTRVDENDFANMTWSCIHEGGHALYEQGLNPDDYGLPVGSAASLAIHESQSRLWENNVGRSKAYWTFQYPKLKKIFPDNLKNVSLDNFYKSINSVKANLIRTEADELHYHLHVMIRYEIEKEIVSTKITAKEVRELWNEKYKEYLGVKVTKDSEGILQDVHWSHGSIGYFPTYSLGSFYAAQFFNRASNDIPTLKSEIEKGNSSSLLHWLRENIHKHGAMYDAEDLCKKVTGEKLNFQYFMEYVKDKY
jgi:carboxypeptidase Taq